MKVTGVKTTVLSIPNAEPYYYSQGCSLGVNSVLVEVHTDEGIMKQLLGTNFVYNRKRLQGGDFKIRTCAMWCVARLYLSDMELREFQQMFSKSVTLSTPDDIVSILCLLSFSEV